MRSLGPGARGVGRTRALAGGMASERAFAQAARAARRRAPAPLGLFSGCVGGPSDPKRLLPSRPRAGLPAVSTASTQASVSPGGTSMPDTPCSIISGRAPSRWRSPVPQPHKPRSPTSGRPRCIGLGTSAPVPLAAAWSPRRGITVPLNSTPCGSERLQRLSVGSVAGQDQTGADRPPRLEQRPDVLLRREPSHIEEVLPAPCRRGRASRSSASTSIRSRRGRPAHACRGRSDSRAGTGRRHRSCRSPGAD